MPHIFTRDNYVFESGNFIVCELYATDADIRKNIKLALDCFSKVDKSLVELFAAVSKGSSKNEIVGLSSQAEFEEKFGTAATITIVDKRTKIAVAMTERKAIPPI